MNTAAIPSGTAIENADGSAKKPARARLFCVPYAGGSAQLFRGWPAAAGESLDIRAIELPGRGARFGERPGDDLNSLAPALAQELRPELDGPFALFGHSMGALIAFELVRYFRRVEWPLPVHLFVSGACAPHRRRVQAPWYDAPLPEFVAQLQHLNGSPAHALIDDELMQTVLPYLRADFKLVQCYTHQPEAPLSMPITAFGGLDDRDVTAAELEAWGHLTTGRFEWHLLPGDHFFLRAHEPLLIGRIVHDLCSA